MYKTHINYKEVVDDSHRQLFTMPSETIQGETYTIRELLNKHTRHGTVHELLVNAPDTLHRQPIWDEDADFNSPDYNQLNQADIVDKNEVKNQQMDIIKELESIQKQQTQQRLDNDAQAIKLTHTEEERSDSDQEGAKAEGKKGE